MIILWFIYDSDPPDPPDQTNRVQYASQACKEKDVHGPTFSPS